MKKIALLPGGFKPPHAGHYNMAKWLAKNTDADVVVVKVGAKERDGITREMSLQLWNLYKESDSDPLSNKLLIQPSTSNSPVQDVYDFVEDTAPEGSTVYLGMGEKDTSDSRFKNIGKFAEPRNIQFQTVLVPPQAGGVSGTEMRGFIKNNQDTFFYNSLPDHMTDMDKEDAWAIVIPDPMNEDLYESGADTAWEDEEGNKVTLQDILDLTKNLPIKNFPTEKLAKIVLNWDDNPEEIERISQVTVSQQYPILIMVDESGKIQWILDGNHRAQKALRSKAKTIPAKLIKPSNLSPKAKKIFSLDEDLYDPNDHTSDYMKSSEWKAGMPDGPKKDITPSYKYKRGGLYGKMYNETVTDTDIICDNCGWTWDIVDGGDDLYICHTCGHDNTPNKMSESTFSKEWWKGHINEILNETKANTHLTHLEELILTQGQDGYNQAKSFLYELIKNLKGEDNTIKNVSVKWDGAPAIFTGINPDNGKFFVGTKSVFNKSPKINYTSQDIDVNHGHAPGLAKKLKLALQYLPPVGIQGILQGDFMFDNDDVESNDIDGTPHYTFKPNTIRYAVEANSELGKRVLSSKIGIIFHTTYKDLSGGGASFGADISGLNPSNNVWFDDAYFKDATGVLLSNEEEQEILSKINEADSINVKYNELPMEISSNAKINLLNTYLNSEVRKGEFISDPFQSFEMFKEWYKVKFIEKAVSKYSPQNQEAKRKQFEDKLRTIESKKDIVINLFKVSKLLSEAKNIFIAKYDKAVATKHFIDNGDGTLSVTKAEGFVAVDHTESGIKLVDRLEFSKNNFNAGKPGAKN